MSHSVPDRELGSPGFQTAELKTAGGESDPVLVVALERALALRIPAKQRSVALARRLVLQICGRLDLDERQRMLADLCVRVHDLGMISLPDSVLLGLGALSATEWELVRRHPLVGARLLAELPGLAASADIVCSHHERWDGNGYPRGSRGREIPRLSRVIATVDAFVAMAVDRPHRPALDVAMALETICDASGQQFDPEVVDALAAVLAGNQPRPSAQLSAATAEHAPECSRPRPKLERALTDLNALPIFAGVRERVIAITSNWRVGDGCELVAAIETDIGLTVAVLRRALDGGSGPITNVSDAVSMLGPEVIGQIAAAQPVVDFPGRTPFQASLFLVAVHGRTVAAISARLAAEARYDHLDDLIAAGLLHDVGKLVMLRAYGPRSLGGDPRDHAPERRVDAERQLVAIDHGTCGGLLTERWGLPHPLCEAIARHHQATTGNCVASFVRLADMVAHHAHGDVVDDRQMLTLAASCGVSERTLRDALFELPGTGGGRRRAEPSPLSPRETETLRALSAGSVYKQIALEHGVSEATVRAHAHNAYAKLRVTDRAQAVLRAKEQGWI